MSSSIPREKSLINSTNLTIKNKLNFLYLNFYKFRSVEERVKFIKEIQSQMSIYPANQFRDNKIYSTYILESNSIIEL
jgi:hypothetical protein